MISCQVSAVSGSLTKNLKVAAEPHPMRLILASNSPRRSELLRNAGYEFEIDPSGVEEGEARAGEAPEQYARRVARSKAIHVASRSNPGCLVLGADTIVAVGGAVLGKPRDAEDAARMLRMLSGQTHHVTTAICLVRAPDRVEALDHATTLVTFRELEDREISAYATTPEPLDKAGAYAIQGLASKFVVHISGCYFNVVGLPVSLLDTMLKPLMPSGAAG